MHFNKFNSLVIVTSLLGLALTSCGQSKKQSDPQPQQSHSLQGVYISSGSVADIYTTMAIKVLDGLTISRCGIYTKPPAPGVLAANAEFTLTQEGVDANGVQSFSATTRTTDPNSPYYTIQGTYDPTNDTLTNVDASKFTSNYIKATSEQIEMLTSQGCFTNQ